MKNLMNLAIVLFVVSLLTGSMLAQQGLGPQNLDSPRTNWVDADGDGICDNVGTDLQGANSKAMKMNKGANKGTGVGDGTGSGFGDGSGVRPQDGTGFGRKSGSVSDDGTVTLQKGSGRRGSK